MVRAALHLFQLFIFLMKGSVVILSLSDILLCFFVAMLGVKNIRLYFCQQPGKGDFIFVSRAVSVKITEQLYGSWDLRDSLPNVLFCFVWTMDRF